MSAAQSIPLGVLTAAADSRAGEGASLEFRRLLDGVWSEQTGRLAALVVALGLRSEQAADVLQDVYLAALARPPAIGEAAELSRWLFRVTANRAQLEHRRRGRWRRLWQTLAGAWRTSGCEAPCGELNGEVERALRTLDADDRMLVAMRYFVDLNSREIAQIVGIPESTVRGRSAPRRPARVGLSPGSLPPTIRPASMASSTPRCKSKAIRSRSLPSSGPIES